MTTTQKQALAALEGTIGTYNDINALRSFIDEHPDAKEVEKK